MRANRQVYSRDPRGGRRHENRLTYASHSRMLEVNRLRTAHASNPHRPDAPIFECVGAMARVKATLLRRRFAALTRAIRSRKSGLGIYRSVERISSQALVQERTRATNDPIRPGVHPRQASWFSEKMFPQTIPTSSVLPLARFIGDGWYPWRTSSSVGTAPGCGGSSLVPRTAAPRRTKARQKR